MYTINTLKKAKCTFVLVVALRAQLFLEQTTLCLLQLVAPIRTHVHCTWKMQIWRMLSVDWRREILGRRQKFRATILWKFGSYTFRGWTFSIARRSLAISPLPSTMKYKYTYRAHSWDNTIYLGGHKIKSFKYFILR